MFIVAGILYVWVGAANHRSAAITAVLQVPLISTLARLRSRVPRSAKAADYDDKGLRFLSTVMGLQHPSVRLARRSDESVRLRGTTRQPTILISPLSLVTWTRDTTAHAVQLAHEMGHLWAKDLGRFYFLSTGVLLIAGEVVPITANSGTPNEPLVLIAAASALLGLRSFLRSREHAADFLAAQVLGAQVRDVLPDVDVHEGRLPPLLSAHPTPAQRRSAFNDTDQLYAGLRLPMFAFGYSTALALDMATAACRVFAGGGSRTTPLQVLLIPSTIIVGLVFGGLLASGAILAPERPRRSWFRSFLLGTLACLLLLTRSQVTAATIVVCMLAVLIAAKILVPLSDGVFLLVAEVEHIDAPLHRLAQAVAPAAAWFGLIEFYYFRGCSPMTHVIAHIPPISSL